jgi:hypothetical protein
MSVSLGRTYIKRIWAQIDEDDIWTRETGINKEEDNNVGGATL